MIAQNKYYNIKPDENIRINGLLSLALKQYAKNKINKKPPYGFALLSFIEWLNAWDSDEVPLSQMSQVSQTLETKKKKLILYINFDEHFVKCVIAFFCIYT